MPPSITAVIVSYNHGVYLRQAIESILHQTLPIQKTLIINNGSTDFTEKIAREYVELYFPSVEYHSYAHNHGQRTAFNRGLDLAQTDYVFFLDADDELDHTYAAKVFHSFSKNQQAVLSYSDTLIFGARERSAWLDYPQAWRVREGSSYTLRYPSYSEAVKYELKKNNFINNAAMFKTKCAREVGGFVEHEIYSLRHYLWYRLFDAGHTAVHCPHVLYRYRQYALSQESQQWKVRHIAAAAAADQHILYYQEKIEQLKNSPFYKTEQLLSRLADNFKCDCQK